MLGFVQAVKILDLGGLRRNAFFVHEEVCCFVKVIIIIFYLA